MKDDIVYLVGETQRETKVVAVDWQVCGDKVSMDVRLVMFSRLTVTDEEYLKSEKWVELGDSPTEDE